MQKQSDLKTSVQRGAQLLDRKRPGWHGRIDVDQLRMEECERCVLGQVFGEYRDGLLRLFPGPYLSEHWAGSFFGFCLFNEDFFLVDYVDPQWHELRDLWLGEINQRQEAA